ncbi:hypothetical protein OCS_04815 [Ophiocordyceps sinensis CO18]|nr:hypothetical protein OCS_04815 [Ophiocordyceps sinensis CO18]
MPTESNVWSRRDSWPPTQVRLSPSMSKASSDPRPLLEDMDDNPLTYFLTPTPDNDMGDMGDDDMVFDAGIEDSSQPREIVRSLSPSSLEGLGMPKARAGSPELDSDGLTTDDDDDEDYVRFSPGSPSRLAPLRNIAIDGLRLRTVSPVQGRTTNGLLSPASYPATRSRGRSSARTQRVTHARSMSARPRPGRLWREPSPDVWSIEEETEEEVTRSQTGFEGNGSGTGGNGTAVRKTAAKPNKRVRFLLPAKE